jgi:hypothetical protein
MTGIRRLAPNDDLSQLIALSRDFFEEYSVHHIPALSVRSR